MYSEVMAHSVPHNSDLVYESELGGNKRVSFGDLVRDAESGSYTESEYADIPLTQTGACHALAGGQANIYHYIISTLIDVT